MGTEPRPVPRRSYPPALAALLAALFLAPLASSAQEPGTVVAADPRVQGLTYAFPDTGEELPYALFVPADYDASRAWPLIVALHGLGRPYDWMMGYQGFVDDAERDGYIVVAPKGYHPRAWYGTRGLGIPNGAARDGEELPDNLGELAEHDVMDVLGIVRDAYNIDDDRIYLWGHSMGGAGSFHFAAMNPDIWAGVAVAAPATQPDDIGELDAIADANIPVLVLQGDEDALVPVEGTRRWIARMGELGMQHVYAEIDGADHSNFINSDPAMISKVFSFFDIVRKNQRGSGR